MKKHFSNSSKLECIFTDEGVSFYGPQQEVFFPYGCIDTLKISLLGVLQIGCRSTVCSFAVDRRDRIEMKEMIRFARDAMKAAPKAEPKVIDLTKAGDGKALVSADLPAEEQLKQYKTLFIQGIISKQEYDLKKLQLTK